MFGSSAIVDYGFFSLATIAALSGLSLWLQRHGVHGRTLAVSWIFLSALLLVGWFLVGGASERERMRLRKWMAGLAPTYARELEEMGHARITLDTSPDDPLYRAMIAQQTQWLQQNPMVADIYTFRKRGDGHALIVDSETDYDGDGAYRGERESRTSIGESWERASPALQMAYSGQEAFDDTPYDDRWGRWVSVYVPMRDAAGDVEAVLGIDFPAAGWSVAMARARWSVIGVLAVIAVIGVSSATVIAMQRVTIAERRKAEEQQRESLERTRLIIDTANEAFVAMDSHGRITDWNPQAEAVFGWKKHEVLGRVVADTIIPAQHRDGHRSGLQRFTASGDGSILNQRLEVTALRRDGSEFPVELTITPVRLGDDHIFHGFLHDISERKRAEDDVKASEALYHSLVVNLPIYVTRKDLDGRITYANRSFCDLVGMGEEEIIGKTDYDFFPVELADKYRCDDERVIETGKVFEDIEENRRGNERNFVDVRKTPVRDANGRAVGIQVIFWDVTEEHLAKAALHKAKDAAEAAARAKSEFLANMSHEIRTPMNGIIGMAELLANTTLTPEQRDFLGMARQSADSLLRLLNDILDFSKIEAGKLELDPTPFALRDCVAKTMQTLSMRAGDKELELACRIAPGVHDDLVGDVGRLQQVIVNLVGNAVKFTEQGEVVVEVDLDADRDHARPAEPFSETNQDAAPDEGETVTLHFSVRDTGIGIPQEKCARIFEAFSQADSTTTRRFGGTGLGLTISSELVEMMRGRMWVASEVGKGTTFHFTVELDMASEPVSKPAIELSSMHGMPVLVVDDNATNRRILAEVLSHWQLQPTVTDRGAAALEELRRAAGGDAPYSLVLLDSMMPEMDGFDFARRVQSEPAFRALPIIMISSAARPGDAEKCRELGIVRYMTKPVVQSELLETIMDAVGEPAVDHASSSRKRPDARADRPGLKVLLAEDGLVNQRVATGLLGIHGHHVTIANDGSDAVAAVAQQPYDVILMDVQMPRMDGLEATSIIRQREQSTGSHTPIIAMTASAMKGDRERCLAAGMDGYLSKPIDPEQLFEMLDRYAPEEPESSGEVDSAATPQTESPQTESPQTENSQTESPEPGSAVAAAGGHPGGAGVVIDLEVASKRLPGGIEGIKEVAQLVLRECPRTLDEIKEGIVSGDAKRVQRGAHTLKGSADVFGAGDVVDAALRVEMLGASGELGEAPDAVSDLEHRVAQLRSALHDLIDHDRG